MATPSPSETRAIEAALDLIVQGFQRLDISSLSDLVTDTTLLMPAERTTAKGPAVLDRFRNIAQSVEGFKLLSTDMQALGERHIFDTGTLRFRNKASGEQSIFRYMMVWHKEESDWKLAGMSWNRETASRPQGSRSRSPAAASSRSA